MNRLDKNQADEWEWVSIVAGCLLSKDGKYLLVQEKQARAYGLWNLPAGHVDKGESLEETAAREVKEETNYEVTVGQELGLFHAAVGRPVIHIFDATIISGELAAQADELLDAQWLSYAEIKQLNAEGKLRAPWIMTIMQKRN